MGRATRKSAFTLIELLVVVTIIVVLLALLAPAMEKAIYRAELTVCASQLRGIGSSVTMYAHEYKRFYPYRGLGYEFRNPSNNQPYGYDQAAELKYHPVVTERPVDQRPILKHAMPDLNKQLNDPLTAKIDLEQPTEIVFSPYNLWWGFTYFNPARQETMLKLGERWTYAGQPFEVLAGDRDLVRPAANIMDVQTSHPDSVYEPGFLRQLRVQNQQGPWLIAAGGMTMSCWYSDPSDITTGPLRADRGPVDNNYVMTDLSVAQYNRVTWVKEDEEDRMRFVATFSSGSATNDNKWMFMPGR